MSRKTNEYWRRVMGLPPKDPQPAPQKTDVSVAPSPREHPRCVRCGGQPNLGRSTRDGKVAPMCNGCAEEEWLEMLTDEERKLLRGRCV